MAAPTTITTSDHLSIVQKICESDSWINNSDPDDVAMYIYSSAIYETWIEGSELEKKLANKLVKKWMDEIRYIMQEDYMKTKHEPNRLERIPYLQQWLNFAKARYSDHPGLKRAVQCVAFDDLKYIMP
jgi:hypothetical protein